MPIDKLNHIEDQQELRSSKEHLLQEDGRVLAELITDVLEDVETAESKMSTSYDRKGVKECSKCDERETEDGWIEEIGPTHSISVYPAAVMGDGYYGVTYDSSDETRRTCIERQMDNRVGTETLTIIREPKEQKTKRVRAVNPQPAPADAIVADLAQCMLATLEGKEAPKSNLTVGDLTQSMEITIPVFEEEEGDFSVTIVSNLADGKILSLKLRHPMMRSWPPNEEISYFGNSPVPQIVHEFLSAPLGDGVRPSVGSPFLPFFLTVGEGEEQSPIGKGIVRESIQKLWPTLFPRLRGEITKAIEQMRSTLPEPKKKYSAIVPTEFTESSIAQKVLSAVTGAQLEEVQDCETLDQDEKDLLCRAAWNLIRRPEDTDHRTYPSIREAEKIVKEHGFAICKMRFSDGKHATIMIEVFQQPATDRIGLAKPISKDPFSGVVTRAQYSLESIGDGDNPEVAAQAAWLMEFLNPKAGGGKEPGREPENNNGVRSRGGLPRAVVDTIVKQIGEQLELPTRLPFGAEHRLLVNGGHSGIANSTVLEWGQEWAMVEGEPRGVVIGGREFMISTFADHRHSAYGNVVFRVVAELGRGKIESGPSHPYKQALLDILEGSDSSAICGIMGIDVGSDNETIVDYVLAHCVIGGGDGTTQETAVTIESSLSSKIPCGTIAILLSRAWLRKNYPEAQGSISHKYPEGKIYDIYTFKQPVNGVNQIWFQIKKTDPNVN